MSKPQAIVTYQKFGGTGELDPLWAGYLYTTKKGSDIVLCCDLPLSKDIGIIRHAVAYPTCVFKTDCRLEVCSTET